MVQVREAVAHLFSLGRFEGVQRRRDARGRAGGAPLRPGADPSRLEDPVRGPAGRARHRRGRAAPRRRSTAMAPRRRSAASADMTRILSPTRCASAATCTPSITPRPEIEHDPERATLVFTIDPGARTTDRRGRGRSGRRPSAPKSSIALGLAPGRAVPARGAQRAHRALHRGAPQAAATTKRRSSRRSASARGTGSPNLTLTVTPGPRVRVVFTGDPLPSDQRAELVPVEREGSVDEDLLEDSSNRIEEYLRAQGYRDATAPHTREVANGELVITFAVTRGQQYQGRRRSRSRATRRCRWRSSPPACGCATASRSRPPGWTRTSQTIEDLYHRRGFAAREGAVGGRESSRATPPPAQVPVAVRVGHHRGRAHDGRRRDVHRQPGGAGRRRCARRVALQPGAPYVPGQLAVDRDAIQLAYQDLGYESATVDASARVQPGRHARGRGVRRSARGRRCSSTTCSSSATCGRSTETIERELQVKRGRSVQPQRHQRQPAAADRARPVPARAHHRAAARRRDDARSAGDDRGRAGHDGGLRRRRRRAGCASSAAVGGRRRQRTVRGRAARVLPDRPPERVRQEPIGELLFAASSLHSAAGRRRRRSPSIACVGTFREPRVFDTGADAFVNVTFEQQTRSSFNFSRRSLSADVARHLTPRRQRHRQLSAPADARLRRTAEPGGSAADRPAVSAVPAVVVLGAVDPRHARRCGRPDARRDTRAPTASWRRAAIGSRGRLRQVVLHRAGVSRRAGHRAGSCSPATRGSAWPPVFRATAGRRARRGDSRRADPQTCRRASASTPAATPRSAASRSIASGRRARRSTTICLPIGGNGARHLQRRAARAGDAARSAWSGSSTPATSSSARPTSISPSCAARSAAASATSRRSGRSASISDSRSNRYPGEGLTAWFVSFGQAF